MKIAEEKVSVTPLALFGCLFVLERSYVSFQVFLFNPVFLESGLNLLCFFVTVMYLIAMYIYHHFLVRSRKAS